MIKFLMNLGVVRGMTFRTIHEEGVGVFIVPNPQVNRMQINAIPAESPPARERNKRVSGRWVAKPLHVCW
jgi:hypothetical protein